MRGRSARQENTASLSRRRVPGWPVFPALRMLRVVAGALALAMVLSLVLQAQAARRLTALVDTSWRGSFDLIVSAPGATLAVADVAAPLDTAAWTSSADRLSVGDLDRIRAVPGVEVAAPLGDLGRVAKSIAERRRGRSLPRMTGRSCRSGKRVRATASRS